MRALEPVAFAVGFEIQICLAARGAVLAVVEIDDEGVGEEGEEGDEEGGETHFGVAVKMIGEYMRDVAGEMRTPSRNLLDVEGSVRRDCSWDSVMGSRRNEMCSEPGV